MELSTPPSSGRGEVRRLLTITGSLPVVYVPDNIGRRSLIYVLDVGFFNFRV